MLSYIAHIPHSPLLLPQISRGKFRQFKKMHQAVVQIKDDLYCRGCETLILLSPALKIPTELEKDIAVLD